MDFPLNDAQRTLLSERYPHFAAERCSALFHQDQPPGGLQRVEGQGDFACVRMANSVAWFPGHDKRPTRDGRPMKTKAARGSRRLLADTLAPDELVVVEGEGDAVALVSVGMRGVVATGGVKALVGNGLAAREKRRTFKGKTVRLMFDPDADGRAYATPTAQALLRDGARRVAIAHPPKEGQDVEAWLCTFVSPTQALAAVQQLLAAAPWVEESTGRKEEEPEPIPIQSARMRFGGEVPALVLTTWDRDRREPKLAVFAPSDLGHAASEEPPPYDCPTTGPWVWRILDAWIYDGQSYVPDVRGDTLKALERGALVLPPPPYSGVDSSEQLWRDVRAFIQRWVALRPDMYDALVACVFLSYRLHDAEFPYTPYIRLSGRTGTGKGRALEVLGQLAYRAYSTQPTADNLHRVVDFHGDVALLFDEFHTDRGRARESQEKLVDLLNLGFCRKDALTRVVQDVPREFQVFGFKIFAGYGHDEHEAFARRTVLVEMGGEEVPARMRCKALPDEFYEVGEALRGRLLAWRARKLPLGRPDGLSDRSKQLDERAGMEIAQVFWPLAEMVPAGMDHELENVIKCAEARRADTATVRETSLEARILDALAQVVEDGEAYTTRNGVGVLVPTEAVVKQLAASDREVTGSVVVKILRELRLPHRSLKVAIGGRLRDRRGFFVGTSEGAAAHLQRVMQLHGVRWPRAEQEAGM